MNKSIPSQIRYLLLGTLFVLLIISVLQISKIFLIENYFDYTYYYLALHSYLNGVNPYLIKVFPFPYPPAALFLLLPFMVFPMFVSSKIFVICSFLLLIISLSILFRLFKIPIYSLQSLVLIILVLNYFPLKYSLAGGQINTFVLLCVVFFVKGFSGKQYRLAGAALAVAIALKLFLLFVIPYLFIIKKYSILKSFFISFLVISIFILLIIPTPIIASFFNTILPELIHTGGGNYYFDQSLSAFIARSFNLTYASQIAKPLAIIILLITYYVLWKLRDKNKIELLGISILLNLNIILSNFAWQHHFIWMLIPYLICFIYIRDNHLPIKLYFVLILSYVLTTINIPNPRLVLPILQSHVFYGAVILYFLLFYLIFKQSKIITLAKTKSKNNYKSIPKKKLK